MSLWAEQHLGEASSRSGWRTLRHSYESLQLSVVAIGTKPLRTGLVLANGLCSSMTDLRRSDTIPRGPPPHDAKPG